MDLSIIIVNWNTCRLLTQCLTSIYDKVHHYTFEVIVVDNASTDQSVVTIRQQFPQVRLVENNENMGFAGANNQGLAIAQGRYVLLLNSDTIVLPAAFDDMVRFADQHPEAGMIGCKLLNEDGSLQESWAAFPTFWSELTGRLQRHRQLIDETQGVFEVDWVGGACLLARASALATVGFLDDSYFMYSEETDWCFRVRQQGWKIYYLAEAKIIHLGGGSANRASLPQLVRLYESKIRFFDKHYGKVQATSLRYGLALANSVGLIRRALGSFRSSSQQQSESGQRITVQWQLIKHLLRGPVSPSKQDIRMG
ncbi:MAG: glycosyltransferase family 2 protein [Anaerolineae bacterium]|nr:glycosyltransferase family 2 protein [Anaerolineae bacterium]